MRELAQQDLPYERQMWPRDEAKRFFGGRGEPLKVQLIDEKTEGQAAVSCYTIKDSETFVDFCVGPHVPSTGRLKAFKLLDHLERLLEGRRAQPADAARLRHGVPHPRRSCRSTCSGSRKRRSATTGRSASDQKLFMFHQWAPGAAVLAGQGDDALQHAGATTCAACSSRPATSR